MKNYKLFLIAVKISDNWFLIEKNSSWFDYNVRFISFRAWKNAKGYLSIAPARKAIEEIKNYLKINNQDIKIVRAEILISDIETGEIIEDK